jgi:hypothetical protein
MRDCVSGLRCGGAALVGGDARHQGAARARRSEQRWYEEEAKGFFVLMKPCCEVIRTQGSACGGEG